MARPPAWSLTISTRLKSGIGYAFASAPAETPITGKRSGTQPAALGEMNPGASIALIRSLGTWYPISSAVNGSGSCTLAKVRPTGWCELVT